MYEFYNPNPCNRLVGDCVIRAITKVLDKEMRESGGGYSGEMGNGYSGEHYVRGHYSRGYGDYSGDRSYGYSGNRYSNGMEHDGMYMSGRSYGDYSGYRDSRGRYSRDDMMERTKSQIERLMNESQNEEVREALQGALQRLH